MDDWSGAGVVALGVVATAASVVHYLRETAELGSVVGPTIALALNGGLAAGIVGAGWRLRRSELSANERRRVARWAVTGLVVSVGTVATTYLVQIYEGQTVIEPTFQLLIVGEAGTLAATLAGYYAAQSAMTARRFEAVFDNTYQFTGMMAPDGTVIEVNETAQSFVGVDYSAIVGEKLWETYFFRTGPETRETAREAVDRASDGEFFRDQIRIRGDDRDAIVDFSVRPVLDDAGDVQLLIPEGRDITALERRTEHLDVLHRFLRHNVRNKLSVVRGYAERLHETVPDPDRRAHARRVRDSADDLASATALVNELSNAVVDDVDTEPTDVTSVLDEAVESADVPAERVRRLTEWTADTVEVTAGDRLSLSVRLVVDSLLDDGGDGTVAVDLRRADDHVDVEFQCEGCDVAPSELSALEDAEARSQTQHPDGVGLWFAKSVVEGYGGTADYRYTGDDPLIRLRLRTVTAAAAPSPQPDATTTESDPSPPEPSLD
ncbi:hypothetical protein BRD13_01140 [Halobacteriales archaeon SW_5_70_135]|nr:MAG: hypothetical protein BRD13_01140 [Halobacteriales archaeon SW_5_70_135]